MFSKKKRIIQVGKFLASRQIFHGNKWVSILIITILTLTFLSLVIIPGILIGLTEGSIQQQREQLTGDIYLSVLPGEESILITQDIIRTLRSIPEVTAYSIRYKSNVGITSGYVYRDDFTEDAEHITVNVFGINPEMEEKTTKLSRFLVEGEMINSNESGYVLVGSNLLRKYSKFSDMFEPLRYVKVGEPIKLTFYGEKGNFIAKKNGAFGGEIEERGSGNTAEFIVKGIVRSKVGDISSSIFVTDKDYRRMTGNKSLRVQEIIVKHDETISDEEFKKILESYGFQRYAKIETAEEAIPKFLYDVQKTFSLLGNMVGLIGLIVSSITVFIVIYINALTRRKFIGILKGIGISGRAIELSYLLQSFFYALVGISLGLIILYGFLVPYFQKNPIDFPMSDGMLVADLSTTFIRAAILLLVTMGAGYLPAHLIVRKNTLDSILQR